MQSVTISKRCLQVYPWMKFGYCFVRDIGMPESLDYLRDQQRNVEIKIKKNSHPLIEASKSLSRFFKEQGEKRRSHIESLIRSIANGKNIKPVGFIVDAVMVSELQNALLLGVHDSDRINGPIVLDAAKEGETFVGIGKRPLQTRKNEVVLKDDLGIWASYTQGPDERTIVHSRTESIIILGFFTPNLPEETMSKGIGDAVEILQYMAGGVTDGVEILPR